MSTSRKLEADKISLFFFSVLTVVVLLAGAAWTWRTMNPITTTAKQPLLTLTPSAGGNGIAVSDQKVGKTVTVDAVVLRSGGYVMIHESSKGKPGRIISTSEYVPAGETANLAIALTKSLVDRGEYFAMLHTDNGDQKFNVQEDVPLKNLDGNTIMVKFKAAQ